LKEAGLIQELNIETDQARFDPNMKPHAHLVCLQCKSINDCTDPMVSEIVDRMSNEANFSSGGWNFNIFGICSNCRRKKYMRLTLFKTFFQL
jgi:Fur family peroxide stress response transcriptional regulator